MDAAIEALKERNEDEEEEEENEEEEYEDGLLLPSIWRKKFCLPTKDWTDAILGKRLLMLSLMLSMIVAAGAAAAETQQKCQYEV